MAQQAPSHRPTTFYPNPPPAPPPPPRAFSPPFQAQSPSGAVSSPAPGFQGPPPKRQRTDMSPVPQSPQFASPLLSTIQLPNSQGQPNTNGVFSPQENRGSMPPPSRPPEKEKGTDIRTIEDSLSGTGVNIDDEERALTNFGATSFPPTNATTSFTSQSSLGANGISFEQAGSITRDGGIQDTQSTQEAVGASTEASSAEEASRLENAKANYVAAGRRAYELTDPFLLGDAMERRLNMRAYENGIKSPKDGLYHARKDPNRPLQKMQVVAPDGTVRVIDQGQTILNSDSGTTLINLMDLISLACKARITGILDLAARLGKERRDFANGRIPDEWNDIAEPPERATSPPAAQSLKRTHSQANGTTGGSTDRAKNVVVETFRNIADRDFSREEARLNKRLKRTSSVVAVETTSAASTPGPGTPTTPLDSNKKVTKKDQKVAEAKFTEAQQHKHANETARMATTNLLGSNMFGNKKKTYSWMTGGGGARPSPTPMATTAAKINSALSDNAQPVVTNGVKQAVLVPRGKQFGNWDDGSEKGKAMPLRDILTILEHDDRAVKALQQGYNKPEGRD